MSLILSCNAPASAQSNDAIAIEISAGFDGYYKEGHWIPIRVVVENNGSPVEGTLEVSVPRLNNAETTYAVPINLPTVSRKETLLYVFPEGFLPSSSLQVSILAEGQEILAAQQRVTPVNPTDRLVGVLADSPSAFNLFADIDPPNGKTIVAQLDPGALPDKSQALAAVDVLVISDIDTGEFSTEQIEALSNWVTGGGQLFVGGGPGWQKAVAGLAEMLPFEPSSTVTLSDLSALAAYAGPEYQAISREVVVATGNALPGSEIHIQQDGVPLIVSRSQGNGAVIFLAADPALEPLRSWPGLQTVYSKLLSQPSELPGWADGFQNWDSALEAAKSLTGLSLPLSWMVCSFLGLYVIILGPLNLFILSRFRRRELAWVTIPVLVIAFSGLAFALGSQFRGGKPILNRLAVIQVWPGVEQARVDGTIGLFSPHRKTYDLMLEDNFISHPFPNARGIAGDDWSILVEQDSAQIKDIRMEVGELTALAVEGTIPAPSFGGSFTLHVNDRDTVLEGEIANQSGTILRDSVLLAPGTTMPIGDLLPGETRPIQISLQAAGRSQSASNTNPSGYPQPASYYYYPVDDEVFVEILGTPTYYDDPTLYRRFNLLNAAMRSEQGTVGRSTGVYLVGWSESSPIPVALNSGDYLEEGESLYIVALPTEVNSNTNQSTLPPALFSWLMLSSGPMDRYSPYETRLYPGEFSLQYRLTYPVEYTMIEDLILHLVSAGSAGPTHLDISLWNHETELWEPLPALTWGDYHVPEPEKFVSEEAEIRVKVENASAPNGIAIEAVDFSLIVAHGK